MTPFDLLSFVIVWVVITTLLGYFNREQFLLPEDDHLVGYLALGASLECVACVLLFVLYCFCNVGMMAWNWIN